MRTRRRKNSALLVAVVAVAALSIPTTAGAAERCTPWLGAGPMTIGVGGHEVTTPWVTAQACVVLDAGDPTDPGNLPSVYVEDLPHTFNLDDFAIWLYNSSGPVYEASVTIRYVLLDGTVRTETVPVPLPPREPGGATCVFYRGPRDQMPAGGCLVYVVW